MAGFKTHFTTSTLVGIGYGAVGFVNMVPLSTCLVAGGACSLAGILPDLDSDSGRPVKEIMSFTAAIVPALMIPRFHQMGLNTEQIVLACATVYLVIRFGIGDIFKNYTVHRGMWHSLPAAVVVGLLAFLLVSGSELPIRLYKSAAFVLGFLVHLVLDEIWSVEIRRGRMRIKKSFGTAFKLFTTKSIWPNVSTYGKLVLLIAAVKGDPYLMEQIEANRPEFAESPRQWWQNAVHREESSSQENEPTEPVTEAGSNPASEAAASLGETPASPWYAAPAAAPYETPAARTYEAPAMGRYETITIPTETPADTARRPFYYPAEESPGRR
jgi:membrane-bound metal-dependent hydrolase YbcI (DUF457 family)